MVSTPVLVLNQMYEPLNVCNVRRAFVLVDRGKAEVLERGDEWIRSVSAAFPTPSVIRLMTQIRRPRPTVRLSRREVFQRDKYTCQYCGQVARDLTLDHVIPRHRGGRHTWENLVTACKRCNHRKAGRTPSEARMRLSTEPTAPRYGLYAAFWPYLEREEGWRKFVPGWDPDDGFA
ncbi:MAG TPA: HNH endonuclease [Dehalococcoidia bacterium]|nr:HNH endonuclease [Dehalococcoidia bacterium]